jgi:hypothetical protein
MILFLGFLGLLPAKLRHQTHLETAGDAMTGELFVVFADVLELIWSALLAPDVTMSRVH